MSVLGLVATLLVATATESGLFLALALAVGIGLIGVVASIIGGSIAVPGIFLQVSLGVGVQSAGSAAIKVLLMGNKLSAGTATVEEVVAVTTIDQARTLFGAGSELFLMAKAALDAHPGITLSAIPVAESGGNQATGTLAFTGTATADGAFVIKVLGEEVQAVIASGDDATDVGDAVEAAINAKTDWPVTASNSTGTVTVTAKQAGPRGNEILLVSEEAVAGITHTNVAARLTGGTTSDDPANALTAVFPERYQYIVSADDTFADWVTDIEAHVDSAAEPIEGRRQQFIVGTIDTLANATTLAGSINNPRGRLVWHYNAWETGAMIAATAAAEWAEAFEADRAANTNKLRLNGLLPQRSVADKPTFTELNSALNNGITPLDYEGGTVHMVRAVTTLHQDSSSNPDYRVRDVHKVEVADFMADDIQSNFAAVFEGFKLTNDVDNEVPDPGFITANTARDFIRSRLEFYGPGGNGPQYIENVAELLSRLVVEKDAVVDGRLNGSIPIDPVELFHQGAFDVRQIG